MTEDEINREGYELVGLIKVSREEPVKPRQNKGSSLDNLQVVTNFSFVEGPIFKYGVNPDFSSSKIEVSIDDNDYGFENSDYPIFYKLINSISELPTFKDKISKDYFESEVILWISEVYREKKASQDLINFLKTSTDKVIESQTIYFPIINLHISKPFKIGDVELTFFTKDYFDNLWANNTKRDRTEKEFNELYRKYQGRVFASYTIKTESKKAKEIALKECSLAIDIIKLFSPTIFLPDRKCLIGIEGSLNFNFQSDLISIPTKDKNEWQLSLNARNDPFVINDEMLIGLQKSGISLLSRFILSRQPNELSNLIIQSIILASNAISNFDLHFRVAQLVTIIESLLLEEDRKHKLEKKTTDRLLKLFKNEKIIDETIIDELLSGMYHVRHKIIHKAIAVFKS